MQTESHHPNSPQHSPGNFDPFADRTQSERYLNQALGCKTRLVKAQKLTASSRQAPWRLDVACDGRLHSYVLRVNVRLMEHEYHILKAMESTSIPTPRVYGWDPEGTAFGVPAFLSDYIPGESLLPAVLAGEDWAVDLYLDSVVELQSLTRNDLASAAGYLNESESAADVLETARRYLESHSNPILSASYQRLVKTMPPLPEVRFSNADLWLDNFIVNQQKLSGLIDFEHAGFSDPIFEFLLSFFIRPELIGRGIEARYCQKMGFDPGLLHWYHGLEFYDSLHWVLKINEPYEHHTAESLQADLERWLSEPA